MNGEGYCPHVYYQEFWKNGENKVHKKDNCFSQMGGNRYGGGIKPDRVLYRAEVYDGITEDDVNFYTKFLEEILDKNIFTHKFYIKNGENYVDWDLNCEKLPQIKILLYLSAFRYVQELGAIVKQFSIEGKKIDNLNDLFVLFLKWHYEATNGRLKLYYQCLGGHGLYYPYCFGGSGEFNPITLKEFKNRLETLNLASVQEYFNNAKPNPVPIKEPEPQEEEEEEEDFEPEPIPELPELDKKSVSKIWAK